MGNLEFFDTLALKSRNYLNTARMFSMDAQIFPKTFADINSKLCIESADEVLDLGGGCGQITALISKKCHSVALADGAANALQQAKKDLATLKNIAFYEVNIQKLPLPFVDQQFDKVLCYSVVHYLDSYNEFGQLISDLIRIIRTGGKILIGDIPLAEKYEAVMHERARHPLRNFLHNARYFTRKFLTSMYYRAKKLDPGQVKGIKYSRQAIMKEMSAHSNCKFRLVEQDPSLPFADSREDLLIIKNS